jgi:hypothetical protein
MAYAHTPYTVSVSVSVERAPLHDDTRSWIHDPYSFAGYITLKDEPQYCYHRRPSLLSDAPECCTSHYSEPTTDSSSLSLGLPSTPSPSDESNSDTDAAATGESGSRRRRVRFVRGPCGHKNSKRLRFKNGQGQYICLECNLKWRSAFDEQIVE